MVYLAFDEKLYHKRLEIWRARTGVTGGYAGSIFGIYLKSFVLNVKVLFKENVENHLCLVLREYNADKLQDW